MSFDTKLLITAIATVICAFELMLLASNWESIAKFLKDILNRRIERINEITRIMDNIEDGCCPEWADPVKWKETKL